MQNIYTVELCTVLKQKMSKIRVKNLLTNFLVRFYSSTIYLFGANWQHDVVTLSNFSQFQIDTRIDSVNLPNTIACLRYLASIYCTKASFTKMYTYNLVN